MKYLMLSILLVIFNACAIGQKATGYSTKNKKAIKLYDKAKASGRAMNLKTGLPDYDISLGFLNQAITKDPNFWEAHLMAAEYQEYKGDWKQSLVHYDEAFRINPRHSPSGSSYFYAGNAAYMSGDFDKGIRFIDTYATYKNASQELLSKAEDIRQSCIFSKASMNNPYPYKPINIGPGINTDRPEYFPTITVDGTTLLFTRLVKDSRIDPRIGVQEDFFVSSLTDKGVWMKAESMPTNINSAYNEGAPTIAADGRTLIFVACSNSAGDTDYGDNRNGRGSCDLFVTKKLGAKWMNPENLPGYTNTANWETQPSLSADGKTLYFIRGNKKSNNGSRGGDIYTSILGSDGIWSEPKPLSGIINTPQEEESVLIHPDGKTLYFASRGHIGLGGSDLFMSVLDENGTWSTPVNLGYPINTKGDENSLMVSADGEIGFFASNRPGGFGDLDIYYFIMPEHLRPVRTVYFDGLVFDGLTKKPLAGKFQLIDVQTGKEVVKAEADQVNGSFTVSLPLNKEYALNVNYDGYSFYSKNFNMTNPTGAESVHMDIPLFPLSNDAAIRLDNVFFDLSKATLRKESYVELNKLRDFLKSNPTLKIEIGGHTDTRGVDLENQILSQNRAKAVYDYLVTQTIDAKRMTFKGYGETKPQISDVEIGKLAVLKQEAAHQSNRRTEYKIVK